MQDAASEIYWDRHKMLEAGSDLVGSRVTYRRLIDWVQLGLVPAPIKHGLGRGCGTAAGWTKFGAMFWLDMLRKRVQGDDWAGMANNPVALWVYVDTAPIQYEQVRRALRTWATGRRSARSGHLHRTAGNLANRLAHPGTKASDKRALVGWLRREGLKEPHPERALPPLVRPVMVPGAAARMRTPSWNRSALVAIELVAQLIGSSLLVAAPGADDKELEADLQHARRLARLGMARQASDPGALERAQALGGPVVLVGQARIFVACLDVCEALGMVRLDHMGIVHVAP